MLTKSDRHFLKTVIADAREIDDDIEGIKDEFSARTGSPEKAFSRLADLVGKILKRIPEDVLDEEDGVPPNEAK